jgi:hypothetical protein
MQRAQRFSGGNSGNIDCRRGPKARHVRNKRVRAGAVPRNFNAPAKE